MEKTNELLVISILRNKINHRLKEIKMIDYAVKYQMSLFMDLKALKVNPENISTILVELSSDNYLPSTYQELTSEGPIDRLQMVSKDKGVQINFNSKRIDILKINPDMPKDMELPRDFGNYVQELLGKISLIKEKHAHRLAWITHYIVNEMKEEAMNEFYSKINTSIPFYVENPPHEWDVKMSTRIEKDINSERELHNVISTISRNQGVIACASKSISFDRINIQFDINTHQKNTNTRFSVDNIVEFAENAIGLESEIYHQMEKINV